MALQLRQFTTPGIAQLSYLIGDDRSGKAAVVDPRRDVEIYVDAARELGLTITHIFETHIHADFVSGARELAERVGSAQVGLSREGGARYGFDQKPIGDGDTFPLGSHAITVRHTPGHTPEHLSFVLAHRDRPESPWGILSGDALFDGSAGRPDLLGDDYSDRLADQLFDTLRGFYLAFDDGVIVYPGHGAGSPCGASIGDRLSTTIGYERRHNPFLQYDNKKAFKEFVLSTAPPEPYYYRRMKAMNAEGPRVLGGLPAVPGLPPQAFRAAADEGRAVVVDTRSMLAFGGAHVPGAINIGAQPPLSLWAGWILDPDTPLLLVLEDDGRLDEVLRLFVRTGYTRFAGYLVGGMNLWVREGLPVAQVPQMPVHEIRENGRGVTLLDVRTPGEWAKGHIPDAQHRFLPELRHDPGPLDPAEPVATYCGSGYRASIAASLLLRHGFQDVRNVPGSWDAWTSADYPIEE